MRIRSKLGLSFFALGGAFLGLLLVFIYLGNSLESLRQERAKIDRIQILWNQTTAQLYRIVIDRQPTSAHNEWARLRSNLDSQLRLFISSQVSLYRLDEEDPHYRNLQALSRGWSTIETEFLKLDLRFKSLTDPSGPLLYSAGTLAAGGKASAGLLELNDGIIDFAPYSDLFSNSLQDMIQFADEEIVLRENGFNRLTLILFILTILGSLFFAVFFAGRIAFRIGKVEQAMAAVAEGNFSVRLDLRTRDEFGALSRSFNTLIQDLRNRIGLGFRAMYRLNHAISGDVTQEFVYTAVVLAAAEICGADACALCVWKPGEAGAAGAHDLYVHGNFPRSLVSTQGSDSLVLQLSRGDHIQVDLTDGNEGESWRRNAIVQDLGSLAAHPLLHGETKIGAVIATRHRSSPRFNDLDLFYLEHFAEFGSLTLENSLQNQQIVLKKRMEREMDLAASIQRRLIPRKVPQFPHARIAFHIKPAGQVGGDYFDVLRLPRGRIAVIVCDVAGKGMPASLVMVMVRTILHIISPVAKDAGTIVRYLNAGLAGSVEQGIFATLSLLVLELETGYAEYVNAGHLPALLVRKGGEKPESLDTNGLPIGLEPKVAYSPLKLSLNPGDAILLYSDGITEAVGERGQMYSPERLAEVFVRGSGNDSELIKRSLLMDLEAFIGKAEQNDDQTFVVLKRT